MNEMMKREQTPGPTYAGCDSGGGKNGDGVLRRVILRLFAVAALAAPLAACDSGGGVHLGDDWGGSQAFVLARVNGQNTVVGVDPKARSAQPLAVIPSQADDDDVTTPRITQLGDGSWVVAVPQKSRRPSRLYAVNAKDRVLDGRGTVEYGRVLVPAGAAVAGVIDSSRSSNGKPDAVVYDPATWRVDRTVALPVDPALASGGANGVCVARASGSGSAVAVVPLTGSDARVHNVPGLAVQALTCTGGRPTVAGGVAGAPADGTPATRLSTVDGVAVLTTTIGRVDRIATSGSTIVAAIALPDRVVLVQLAGDTGKELHRVTIKGLGSVDGLRETPNGWVLISGGTVAVANLNAGTSTTFSLPGDFLDAD